MRQYIVKPETQNWRFEITGLGKAGKSCGLTSRCPGLAHPAAAGPVSGWVWNQTDPFLHSNHRPLAHHQDQLLTLLVCSTLLHVINYLVNTLLNNDNKDLWWLPLGDKGHEVHTDQLSIGHCSVIGLNIAQLSLVRPQTFMWCHDSWWKKVGALLQISPIRLQHM